MHDAHGGHATDRVVVVGAGFGVWQENRHVGSARWSDVIRVRAFRGGTTATSTVLVGLALRNGPEVVVHAALPGYQSFLKAAEAALPGMLRREAWLDTMQQTAGVPTEIVLFERKTART